MAFLARLNADFDITVDKLKSLMFTQSNAKLVGSIRDGGLIIEQFEAQGLDGSLRGSGSLAPGAGGLPELDVAVKASGLVLDLRRDQKTSYPDLPFLDVELDLQGQGADLRSVAASANGHLYAIAGAGTIPNSVISRLDAGLIKQLIDVIIPPKAQSSDSQLKCLAARLEVNEGMVRTGPAPCW